MKHRLRMLWHKLVLSDNAFLPVVLMLFWCGSIIISGFLTVGIWYIIYSKLFWYNVVIFLVVLSIIGLLSPLFEEKIDEYQSESKPLIIAERKEREVLAEKQKEFMKEQETKKERRKLLV